jgi:hypothetical protein
LAPLPDVGFGVAGLVEDAATGGIAVEFTATGSTIGVGVVMMVSRVVGRSAGMVEFPGSSGMGSGTSVGSTITLVALLEGTGAPEGSGTAGGDGAPGAGAGAPLGFPPTH